MTCFLYIISDVSITKFYLDISKNFNEINDISKILIIHITKCINFKKIISKSRNDFSFTNNNKNNFFTKQKKLCLLLQIIYFKLSNYYCYIKIFFKLLFEQINIIETEIRIVLTNYFSTNLISIAQSFLNNKIFDIRFK